MSDNRWNKITAITAIASLVFACVTVYVTFVAERAAEDVVKPLTTIVHSNTTAVAVLDVKLTAISEKLDANNTLIGKLLERIPPEVYWLRNDEMEKSGGE
jgi:methionine synthase II (cobalamin-independent)|tara:strand:- start:1117 stop:1416 length:300 start_codon:yes stop_codon:yes gene_type:complete